MKVIKETLRILLLEKYLLFYNGGFNPQKLLGISFTSG